MVVVVVVVVVVAVVVTPCTTKRCAFLEPNSDEPKIVTQQFGCVVLGNAAALAGEAAEEQVLGGRAC